MEFALIIFIVTNNKKLNIDKNADNNIFTISIILSKN